MCVNFKSVSCNCKEPTLKLEDTLNIKQTSQKRNVKSGTHWHSLTHGLGNKNI